MVQYDKIKKRLENRLSIDHLMTLFYFDSYYYAKAEILVKRYEEQNDIKIPVPYHSYPIMSLIMCWCAMGLPLYKKDSDENINEGGKHFFELYHETSQKYEELLVKKEDLQEFLGAQDLPLPEFWFSLRNDNSNKSAKEKRKQGIEKLNAEKQRKTEEAKEKAQKYAKNFKQEYGKKITKPELFRYLNNLEGYKNLPENPSQREIWKSIPEDLRNTGGRPPKNKIL